MVIVLSREGCKRQLYCDPEWLKVTSAYLAVCACASVCLSVCLSVFECSIPDFLFEQDETRQ